MKSFTITVVALLWAASAGAQQVIDSGSTGADGVFHAGLGPATSQVPVGSTVQCTPDNQVPTACTVTVPLREPPNHIFNFTTFAVDAGVTVQFKRNRANTPVIVLIQTDGVIRGTLDLNGSTGIVGSVLPAQGGPGGFGGGLGLFAGAPTSTAGAGAGPGGGAGGFQVGPTRYSGAPGNTIASPELQPLIGGGGGGGGVQALGQNGGGGGGALLIAASGMIDLVTSAESTTNVAINASAGGTPGLGVPTGPGGGGVIRLVATLIKGTRLLTTRSVFQVGGIVRVETPPGGMQWTGTSEPAATFNPPGQPIVIFPPITPVLRIVSIDGVGLPLQPTASAATPDVTLPTIFRNPASVVVEATNVPDGTSVTVIASPQFGYGDRVFSAPTAMSGPVTCTNNPSQQCMRATVPIPLPPTGVGIISAQIDSVVPVS